MPLFEYKGFDPAGKNVTGVVNAETMAEARKAIRNQEIFISEVQLVQDAAVQQRPGRIGWQRFLRVRVGLQDRITFFRQLATLLEAGLQLMNALAVIENSLPARSPLTNLVLRLKDRMTEGQSFSQALAVDVERFPLILVQMVAMGEQSGRLAVLLDDYADLLDRRIQTNRQLQQILAYPVFLLVFGTAVTIFLLRVVVPKMALLFTQNEQLLPLATRILLFLNEFFSNYLGAFLSGTAGLVLGLYLVARFKWVKTGIDRALFNLRGWRRFYQLMVTSRLAMLWATMLKSGLPLKVSLDLSVMTIGNRHMRRLLKQSIAELEAGGVLSQALGKRRIIPAMAVQMLEIGERSGTLEKMMQRVAAYYQTQWEHRLSGLMSLLGPLMIILIGGLVGFVVISVCLPIFELNQLVGSAG